MESNQCTMYTWQMSASPSFTLTFSLLILPVLLFFFFFFNFYFIYFFFSSCSSMLSPPGKSLLIFQQTALRSPHFITHLLTQIKHFSDPKVLGWPKGSFVRKTQTKLLVNPILSSSITVHSTFFINNNSLPISFSIFRIRHTFYLFNGKAFCFKYSSLYIPIPNSQPIPPPTFPLIYLF